jgi:hypothetical protein
MYNHNKNIKQLSLEDVKKWAGEMILPDPLIMYSVKEQDDNGDIMEAIENLNNAIDELQEAIQNVLEVESN